MRLVYLFAALSLLAPIPASAQFDEIGLYADAGMSSCQINDGGGLISVYVIHSSGGAMSSQFMVKASSGATLSYVTETVAFPVAIGNTQSGLAVGYGSCLSSDFLVATISYIGSGTSASCSFLYVTGDPKAPTGKIEVGNCSQARAEAGGARLIINSDGVCECGSTTEMSNWGRIKTRYDD